MGPAAYGFHQPRIDSLSCFKGAAVLAVLPFKQRMVHQQRFSVLRSARTFFRRLLEQLFNVYSYCTKAKVRRAYLIKNW